jgi:type I restriction enzyme S subunit
VTGRPDLPLLSVYRDYGVVQRSDRDDNYNKPGEDPSSYRVVRSGDLVLNKMKTWQGSLGVSNYDGIVSPAYFVAQPLTDDNPAFLHHLLRSAPLVAEYAARSKGIRPSQWDLPWSEFRQISVELPPRSIQERVANYLDHEAARIDALIRAKSRMVALLEERAVALIEDSSLQARWQPVPLNRLIRRISQGWSPQCEARLPEENEWGVLKVGCVNRGEFRPHETKALPTNLTPRPEYTIRPGDLLMSRANTRELVGSAAVVSNVRPKTLLCDKLYKIELDNSKARSRFIVLWLQTRVARDQIELDATGASDSMQNVGQDTVRRIPIPLPGLDEQEAFAARCERERSRISNVVRSIHQQSALLLEHYQALSAAAVTGQLNLFKA